MTIDRDNGFHDGELADLRTDEFVAHWTLLVGEPPSIMLEDRRQMIALLVECVAPASGALAGDAATEEYPAGVSLWAA